MIDTIDLAALRAIGLGAAFEAQLARGLAHPDDRPMRLVEVQRAHWLLHDGQAARPARCQPLLLQELQAAGDALAVGDWVLARPGPGGDWCISSRLLRQNALTRRSAARAQDDGVSSRQVLVSNVDTAVLVMGLDHDFTLRRLERYLALVQAAGVPALLLLSKADTLAPELLARRRADAATVLPPQMPVLAHDLRDGQVAAVLAPWLQAGRTVVLLGSSGAGKSTLTNTLVRALAEPWPAADAPPALHPGWRRDTGAVRAGDSRGRHTTTVRTLVPLPGGACLIDTPGLRALRLDLDDASQLDDAFADVARLAPLCRFRDCQHQQEPGCAVRDGVEAARLLNYHKLLREARRDGRTVLQQQAERALWKARGRAGAARLRGKRDPQAADEAG